MTPRLLHSPLLWIPALALCAYATPGVGTPTTTATLSGSTYQCTATTQITVGAGDPALIAGGVNLLRVDGSAPSVLGVMHDDGMNGDAVAGDGIYTLAFTASTAAMHLQVSGAFRGLVRRLKSTAGTVQVVAPTVTQLSPNSGAVGAQNLSVAITGQYTHFVQGTTTANFGSGITVASLTVNSSTTATAVLNIAVTATLGANDVTLTTGSETATITGGFSIASATLTGDVVTWHYDNFRSGVNPNEATLTPANVNSTSFGKLGEFTVDGQIDGQVLYLHQVNIPNSGMKNVIYFATENDTVYAVDAATFSGTTATVLWHTSLLGPGETAVQQSALPCGDIFPSGITSTPVIDRARNAIYAVARSQDSSNNITYRIHALDLTTGAELFGGPTTITATYPGTGGNSKNGTVIFNPPNQEERAALLESGNTIYTAWSGMYGDCSPYSPWVIAYSTDTLAQTAAIDLAPNYSGGGIWMGGAGPAADSAGNIYVITGNGFGGGTPATGSYANSFVKLSLTGGSFTVADFFAPYNTTTENNEDLDLGGAGPLLLPDLVDSSSVTHHLALTGGKDMNLYVLNRDNMGQFNTTTNNVYQQFQFATTQNRWAAVYFNGTVFTCADSLRMFPVTNTELATTASAQNASVGAAVTTVSSNGTTNGIVWLVEQLNGGLWAFSTANIATALYNSNQASQSRDHFASVGGHFMTPTVADGKVYVGTGSSVVVFGLLK